MRPGGGGNRSRGRGIESSGWQNGIGALQNENPSRGNGISGRGSRKRPPVRGTGALEAARRGRAHLETARAVLASQDLVLESQAFARETPRRTSRPRFPFAGPPSADLETPLSVRETPARGSRERIVHSLHRRRPSSDRILRAPERPRRARGQRQSSCAENLRAVIAMLMGRRGPPRRRSSVQACLARPPAARDGVVVHRPAAAMVRTAREILPTFGDCCQRRGAGPVGRAERSWGEQRGWERGGRLGG